MHILLLKYYEYYKFILCLSINKYQFQRNNSLCKKSTKPNIISHYISKFGIISTPTKD